MVQKIRLGGIRGKGRYIGSNKNIKNIVRSTLWVEKKKYIFNDFKELSIDAKDDDVPVILKDRWRQFLNFK